MTANFLSLLIQGGGLLAWLSCCLNCTAQVVLDFSKSRDIAIILNSGIKSKPMTNSRPGQSSLSFANETVKLILAGGGSFTMHVSLGTVSYKSDGIDILTLNGEQMPTEEIFQMALRLHQVFQIPTTRLEQWNQVASENWSAGSSYTFGLRDSEPLVDFTLLSSHHRLYPRVPQISVAWNLYKGKDRSNIPPPFSEPLELSLNAPSGKRYDLKDGVDVAAVKEFGKKLVEKFPAQTDEFLRKTGQAPEGGTVLPPEFAETPSGVGVPEKPAKANSVGWQMVPVVLAVLAAIALLVRHRLKRHVGD